MKVDIIARTVEIGEKGNRKDVALDFKRLAGKTGGICYMAEDYLDATIQDEENAMNIANFTAKSGHHSVYDHSHVTLSISGIPKMLAMVLNSTNCYVTSEKSARYTVMKPETEKELELYEKWKEKFIGIITAVYPNIDKKTVRKLAQENARYMTSVFTPTTMAYTVSHRQLCYLIDWLDELSEAIQKKENQNAFNLRLAEGAKELSSKFCDVLSQVELVDNKDRVFDFIPCQYGHQISLPPNSIGNTYTWSYFGSFAQLAQAQRHRTLHYTMWFTGDSADEFGFYVPEIIKNTEYEDEWLEDMHSVSYCYPQGTLVRITEEGLANHFFLKCRERECGRAQLEIALQTESTLSMFLENRKKLSLLNQSELSRIAPDNKPVAKCAMKGFICTEACMWGSKHWNTRKI